MSTPICERCRRRPAAEGSRLGWCGECITEHQDKRELLRRRAVERHRRRRRF